MELWSSLLIHHLHRRHQSTFADPDALKCLGLKKTQAQHYVKVEQIMKLGIARGDIFFIHFDGNPLWSYGAVYFYTTFIRAITSLPQIRQVARLRSTTCNLQGLSPTQRSTQTTPSRNLTLGVMQLVTLRSPETMGRDHPCLLALRSQKIEGLDSPQSRRTTGLTPS